MKKTLLLGLVLLFYVPSYAQLHDNTWIFGYDNNPDTLDPYGISMISFIQDQPLVFQNNKPDVNFNRTNSSFSNENGVLLMYTNGTHVYNAEDSIMDGGAFLMDGSDAAGQVVSQYTTIVAWPDKKDIYVLFYLEYAWTIQDIVASGLYYAVIDISQNNGLGKVISKRNKVVEVNLRLGYVVPERHANGRDWWLLMNKWNTNQFYRILIDPRGVLVDGLQTIGDTLKNGSGQCVFSPNGKKYCSFAGVSFQVGDYLDIYDFDRCSGLLSNHKQFHLPGAWGGLGISPNSRYIYVNLDLKAYQYDLEAPDILASRVQVCEWDGVTLSSLGFATGFYSIQAAPDGKLYAATVSSSEYLHIIHRPDEPGLACKYEQHGIVLPTYNAFSMPSFPNYRQGPLDSSACDTLGLDNHPVARWRYEQDTTDVQHIAFRDLSYFEPDSWRWRFGDGSPEVSERHPEHTYAQPGKYEVCLIAANANSADTLCRTLFIGVSAEQNPELQAQIMVGPNPFGSRLWVSLGAQLRSPLFRLYDLHGRLLRQSPLSLGLTEINTAGLPRGMYFWEVLSGGERVKWGKQVCNDER
jgi:hypothetical protein